LRALDQALGAGARIGNMEPATDRSLLPTGEFSRRTGLSLKALRIYDELGLLKPATVQPGSGRRGYATGQIRLGRLIGMLRGAGLSLAGIAAILADLGGPDLGGPDLGGPDREAAVTRLE